MPLETLDHMYPVAGCVWTLDDIRHAARMRVTRGARPSVVRVAATVPGSSLTCRARDRAEVRSGRRGARGRTPGAGGGDRGAGADGLLLPVRRGHPDHGDAVGTGRCRQSARRRRGAGRGARWSSPLNVRSCVCGWWTRRRGRRACARCAGPTTRSGSGPAANRARFACTIARPVKSWRSTRSAKSCGSGSWAGRRGSQSFESAHRACGRPLQMHLGAGVISLSVGLDGTLVSGSGSGEVAVCHRPSGVPATVGHMHAVTTQVGPCAPRRLRSPSPTPGAPAAVDGR